MDSLIAAAIDRTVVSKKDIPDYQLLEDESKIVVSNRTGSVDTLTSDALPQSAEVAFMLASPETIQNLADDDGDFLYLQVNAFEIEGDVATISLSTRWAVAEDSDAAQVHETAWHLCKVAFVRPAGKVNACYIFRQNRAPNGAFFQTCTEKFHLDATISSPLVYFYSLRLLSDRRLGKIVRQVMRPSVRPRNARMLC